MAIQTHNGFHSTWQLYSQGGVDGSLARSLGASPASVGYQSFFDQGGFQNWMYCQQKLFSGWTDFCGCDKAKEAKAKPDKHKEVKNCKGNNQVHHHHHHVKPCEARKSSGNPYLDFINRESALSRSHNNRFCGCFGGGSGYAFGGVYGGSYGGYSGIPSFGGYGNSGYGSSGYGSFGQGFAYYPSFSAPVNYGDIGRDFGYQQYPVLPNYNWNSFKYSAFGGSNKNGFGVIPSSYGSYAMTSPFASAGASSTLALLGGAFSLLF